VAGLGDGWSTGLLVDTCEARGLGVAGGCARVPVLGLELAQPAATSKTMAQVAPMTLSRLAKILGRTLPLSHTPVPDSTIAGATQPPLDGRQ
jgi:hypothetical protein